LQQYGDGLITPRKPIAPLWNYSHSSRYCWDDLGRLNFEQGGEAEDNRIVRLMDIVPPETNTIGPENASATMLRIRDLFLVFQFWYF
jgi:hypothetical protein